MNGKRKEGKMLKILNKLFYLLLIIIFLQLGVFAESNQSIPSNFTTYTHEGLFSISYPKEWEPALSIIEGMRKEVNGYINSIGGTGFSDEAQIVFFGGISSIDNSYNPNVNVTIIPVNIQKIDLKILEGLVDMMIQGYTEQAEEFKKIFQKTEVINGKQAVLLECEARYPNIGSLHALQTILYDGEFVWSITCGVIPPLSFSTYKDDIYAIPRSLKILRSNPELKTSMSFFDNIGETIVKGLAKGLGAFVIYLIYITIKKAFSLFSKKP